MPLLSKPKTIGLASVMLLTSLIALPALSSTSPDGIWSDDGSVLVPAKTGLQNLPRHFRTARLAVQDMQTVLSASPLEQRGQIGTSLFLPMPDGSFREFLIELSPVMAPELAAKYPEITTYRARAAGDAGRQQRSCGLYKSRYRPVYKY